MAGAGKVMRLPPLPTIKEVIQLYKLRAMKQLSQNFLLNPRVIDRFVRSAGSMKDGYACEVGPGPGGITRRILEAGVKHLTVIEKDSRFLPGLELLNEASQGRMTIHRGDVLQFDMSDIFPSELARPWLGKPPNIHILGNLPFSVSTPLIINWLEDIANRSGAWNYGRVKLTLTFQKEVGERMVAGVNGEQRSRLSIMTQYLCNVKYKYDIRGKSFLPPPDVDVAVVQFVPKVEPLIDVPFKQVEKVVRHVFHYRQKMCKRGIQTLFPSDQPELTHRMLVQSEIPPDTRPVQLSVEDFGRLCKVYQQICDENPGLFHFDYRSKENSKEWQKNKVPLGF